MRLGRHPRSLFFALAVMACIGLIAPASIIGLVVIGVREPAAVAQRQQQEMQARLDVLASSLTELLWSLDAVAAREVVEAAMKSPEVVRVEVTDTAQDKTFVDVRSPERMHGAILTGNREIIRRGSPIGRIHIEVNDSVSMAALRQQRRLYLLTVTAQVLVSLALIVVLLNSRIVRPLRDLSRFANDLAEGKFSATIERRHDDEIGRLGERLEHMRDALQRLFAEQRELLARVREREARIRRLVDSNIIGILFADLDGRIIDANDAYLNMIGYTRDDVVAGRLQRADITPPEYRAADARAVENLQKTGRYEPFETEYLRKDGSRVPVLIGGTLFEGTPPQTVAFVLDLSERRQAEAEREARKSAELANRAKSEFLANMSHELRTPLNAILGYAQILKRDRGLTQRQTVGLNTIEAGGRHLLTLINDILDLSRIEAGKLELHPTSVNLPEFLRVVADIIRVKADEKNLLFAFEPAASLPRSISVDERRLRQVMLNLLGNAVKFTDRGQVTLRVHCLRPAKQPMRLDVDVQDTGIGIRAEALTRIFKPFEQVSDVNRRIGGAGLGLAISQALVRLMGGEIRVESTPGQGSRFWFEIPIPIIEADAPERPTERIVAGYRGPRRRVLIVDDIVENRTMLADFLTALGFETMEAADGRDGVTKALAGHPDLILMDNVMPIMDGIEAIRLLRATPAVRDVPIISISASASEAHQKQARAAGADDFLPKPIDLKELTQKLGALMRLELTYDEETSGPASA